MKLSAYDGENQILDLLDLFRDHPGFLVSLSYLLLTMIGVFYSWAFFDRFDVPILQIADFSDFLIAGVREPIVIILLIGGVVVGIGFDRLIRFTNGVQRHWREQPPGVKRSLLLMICYTPRMRISVAFTIVISFVLYTWMFVTVYASWKSEQIRRGIGDKVRLNTVDGEFGSAPVILIGSTLNYIITFAADPGQAYIVPIENIESIVPVRRKNIFED